MNKEDNKFQFNCKTYTFVDEATEECHIQIGASAEDTLRNWEESWGIKFISDTQWCKDNNCSPEEFKDIWGFYPEEENDVPVV